MRKVNVLAGFPFLLFIALPYYFAHAEEITFSTYYPAPYGVYRQMEATITKLVPSDGPPSFISGTEQEGMLYFDNGTTNNKGLYYWDSSANSGAGGWFRSGGQIVSFEDDVQILNLTSYSNWTS